MADLNIRWKILPAKALLDSESLRHTWDQLNAQAGDLAFMSAYSVCAALSAFAGGEERLALAEIKHRVVAILVLVPAGKMRWATFQPSQLPLGAWVAQTGLNLPDLTRSLVRGPFGFCLAVSVTQIDSLVWPSPAAAADYRIDPYIDTAWIDIKGNFEDYWTARGKNLRQNMRKQRNKLATDGITTHLLITRDPADIKAALARYGALESTGWKAAEGTAIHPDNAQGRYYQELFEQAAVLGEAAIYEYLFDQKTVAMNLCLLRNGRLVVLKTSYDETISKTLSPAFLLREEELQRFFTDGTVERIEYFGKVMDWHTKLSQEKRSIFHLTQYRWSWLRALAERRSSSAATQSTNQGTAPAAALEG